MLCVCCVSGSVFVVTEAEHFLRCDLCCKKIQISLKAKAGFQKNVLQVFLKNYLKTFAIIPTQQLATQQLAGVTLFESFKLKHEKYQRHCTYTHETHNIHTQDTHTNKTQKTRSIHTETTQHNHKIHYIHTTHLQAINTDTNTHTHAHTVKTHTSTHA